MILSESDLLDGDIEIRGARSGQDREAQGNGQKARTKRSSQRRSGSFQPAYFLARNQQNKSADER